MRKKLPYGSKMLALLLVFCVLGLCCSTAFGYSTSGGMYYSTTFDPDDIPEGSRDRTKSTTTQQTDSYLPFVTRNTQSTPTGYILCMQYNGNHMAVSAEVQLTNSERKDFTYFSGYGGIGQSYYMLHYPVNSYFELYQVSGYWNS